MTTTHLSPIEQSLMSMQATTAERVEAARTATPVVRKVTVYQSADGRWHASARSARGGMIHNYVLRAKTADAAHAEASGMFTVLAAVA